MKYDLRTILVTGALASIAVQHSHGAEPPAITDKTLVAWVDIKDGASRGGSALTLGQGDTFDALVYGESRPGHWIAGSDRFLRTPKAVRDGQAREAGQLSKIALVHHGQEAVLFLDDVEVSRWELSEPTPLYTEKSHVLFGLRHLGAGDDAFLHGAVEDARIYDRALSADAIAELVPNKLTGEPPFAWWDFEKDASDRMGNFALVNISGRTKIEGGKLHLSGLGSFVVSAPASEAVTYLRFRPSLVSFGDPIPFFWKGRYHIFYLPGYVPGNVPWAHVVSDDLVHWKEMPLALAGDGDPASWDGLNMFTGCIIEHEGRFLAYYTGWNIHNKDGRESVRLATSQDLIHWEKVPDFLLRGDGTIYAKAQPSNFRDPFIYSSENGKGWHMLLAADKVGGEPTTGSFYSEDLKEWTPEQPIGDFRECPDLFWLGGTEYLLGGEFYSFRKEAGGKFVQPKQSSLDSPAVYAGKSLFDGKRRIWLGWLSDRADGKDGGERIYGGYMCTPRELLPAPDGELYVKPVDEVVREFSRETIETNTVRSNLHPDQWRPAGSGFVNKVVPADFQLSLPEVGLLELTIRKSRDAVFALRFHSPEGKLETGYIFTFDGPKECVTTHGQNINWKREGCRLQSGDTATIRAIVNKGTIEVFYDNRYSFSRRTHELSGDKFGLTVKAGTVEVEGLSIRVPTKDLAANP